MSNMKFLFCILGFSLLARQVYCGPEFIKNVEECKKEVGMDQGKPPEMNDPKIKCFSACMMEKMGLMVDGKIDIDKAIDKIKSMYLNADEKFGDKVLECVEKGNSESDKCEVVHTAHECIKQQYGPPKNFPGSNS